jgi:hypothetical protein
LLSPLPFRDCAPSSGERCSPRTATPSSWRTTCGRGATAPIRR